MLDRLIWIETENTYPYRNLAMEEYMTTHVPEGACILFLWQNRHTVVIGKNQNCWKECRVNHLEEEGGYLVRRLSGGGAVFHDLGNLNFTFMVRKADYDVEKQLEVILEAVKLVGIQAMKTGRNDITADGRKFSGNAFYQSGDACYHHGTLMLCADKENMSRYLNVSKEKLASKGVSSVKSRVGNLCEFNPELTVGRMKEALVQAFSQVYGLKAERMDEGELPEEDIRCLTEKFESWQWKYGRKIPFEYEIQRHFPWGGIQIQLQVNEGKIQDINVFSDAMDQEMIGELAERLTGCRYDVKAMCGAVAALGQKDVMRPEDGMHRKDGMCLEDDMRQKDNMRRDITALIKESL